MSALLKWLDRLEHLEAFDTIRASNCTGVKRGDAYQALEVLEHVGLVTCTKACWAYQPAEWVKGRAEQ